MRIDPKCLLRSFNIIYRITNRALHFLDRELTRGWYGHHETLVVTLLHKHGFRLLDLGGNGPFVDPTLPNAFYTSPNSRDGMLFEESGDSTIRWRPPMLKPGRLPGKLYHPVKSGIWQQGSPARKHAKIEETGTQFLHPCIP
jgi:hypothetical protein